MTPTRSDAMPDRPDPEPLSYEHEDAIDAWRRGDFDEVDTSDLGDDVVTFGVDVGGPDDTTAIFVPPTDDEAAAARTAAWVAAKERTQPPHTPADAIAGAADAIAAARALPDADLFAGTPTQAFRDLTSTGDLHADTRPILHAVDPPLPPEAASPAASPPPPAGGDAAAAPPPDAAAIADVYDVPRSMVERDAIRHPDGRPLQLEPQQVAAVDAAPAPAPHRDDALDVAMATQLGLDLGIVHDRAPAVKLTDRFVVPPFSTLDSRQDYWKQRKRAWMGLGIQSELGREGTLTYQTDTVLDPDFYRKKEEAEAAVGHRMTLDEFRRDHYRGLDAPPASIQNTGTSIFDPVLCEVAYRWFSPARGTVLDPFAGGSVRGIVASILGRHYVGVELRPEQVAANRRNAAGVVGPDSPWDFGGTCPTPRWIEGSATDLRALVPVETRRPAEVPIGVTPAPLPRGGADLIFTCPPYADLEVYSDDPRDLSTASYPTFRAMLGSVIAQSVDLLADDRFAVWVVGEARDRRGISYGIVTDTVQAARAAGLGLYNEAILETAIASAAMRATKQVITSRKLVRVHQHVLIFVKGDPRRAAAACGDPMLGGTA